MAVLILGAGGYVGGELAEYLKQQFAVIESTRHSSSEFQFSDIETNKMPSEIEAIVMTIGSTELHNSSYHKSVTSTIASIAKLIDLHNKDGRRLPIIYFSTFHVYGKKTGLIDEETEPLPQNVYSLVHKQAEDLLAKYSEESGTTVVIVRPTNIFGTISGRFPEKRLSMIPGCFMLEALKTGTIRIHAKEQVYRDYVHIKTVSNALSAILNDITPYGRFSILNISTEESHEIGEIAQMVKDAFLGHGIEVVIQRPEFNKEQHRMQENSSYLKVKSALKGLSLDTNLLGELGLKDQIPLMVNELINPAK